MTLMQQQSPDIYEHRYIFKANKKTSMVIFLGVNSVLQPVCRGVDEGQAQPMFAVPTPASVQSGC